MVLKLSWYQFKVDCYKFKLLNVITMVIIEKISRKKYTKRNEKESKQFTTKKST